MADIAKINGVASASIAKVDGIALASIAKVQGLSLASAWADAYCVNLDGSDEAFTASNSTSNSPSNNFSVGIWFRFDTNGVSQALAYKTRIGTDGEYYFRLGSGQMVWNVFGAAGNTKGASVTGPSSGWPIDTWFLMIGTYDIGLLPGANPVKLYRNGTELSYSASTYTGHTGPYTNASSALHIGRRPTGSSTYTDYFNGRIGEMYIWDTTLDSTNIAALYNSGTPIDPRSNSGGYTASANLQWYARFGDDASDNASSTIYERKSNNNLSAVNTEAGDKVSSLPRYSLNFDGSNNLVTVADSASTSASNAFTIAGWMYLETGPSSGNYENLCAKGKVGTDTEYRFAVHHDGTRIALRGDVMGGASDANPAYVIANSAVGTYAWKLVAMTYDSALLPGSNPTRLYINGTELTYGTSDYTGHSAPYTSGTNGLTIGAQLGSGGSYEKFMDGAWANLGIWNTALDSTQLTALYNGGLWLDPTANSGSYTASANLTALWKMCNDSSDNPTGTIYERINNNNGTTSGMGAADKLILSP